MLYAVFGALVGLLAVRRCYAFVVRISTTGILIGLTFGAWNLYQTWSDPLSDDSASALLSFYGPMFICWGLVGFISRRQGVSLTRATIAGASVALISFVVYYCENIVRVNVFLDVLRGREDWQMMVSTFPSSGFKSFRTYVNYIYATGAPFKILVASTIGALTGFIGGLLGSIGRNPARGTLWGTRAQ